MFLFALATLLALTAAEQSQSYLPPSGQGQGQRGVFGSGNGGFNSYAGSSNSFVGSSNSFAASAGRNTRPQQVVEQSATILKQDQDADLNGNFQYSFETSSGIRAAESGGAGQSQGEYSYQGDDGNTYTVTFSAGEGGFQARGAHLPVAPPVPADIQRALEQNARDEAAGIFDDGKYRPSGEDGQYREAQQGQSGQAYNRGGAAGQSGQGYRGGQASQASGQFGQAGFGTANRQGSFNSNSGYNY